MARTGDHCYATGLDESAMRGFLSMHILWHLSQCPCHGQGIAAEIAKYRGKKPAPGTLYPALKKLEEKKLIARVKDAHKEVTYTITPKGKLALGAARKYVRRAFSEILK